MKQLYWNKTKKCTGKNMTWTKKSKSSFNFSVFVGHVLFTPDGPADWHMSMISWHMLDRERVKGDNNNIIICKRIYRYNWWWFHRWAFIYISRDGIHRGPSNIILINQRIKKTNNHPFNKPTLWQLIQSIRHPFRQSSSESNENINCNSPDCLSIQYRFPKGTA